MYLRSSFAGYDMRKFAFLPFIFTIICISIYYFNWFSSFTISAGDFPYYFPSYFTDQLLTPFAWSVYRNGPVSALLWPHFVITAPQIFLVKYFHIPWEMVSRIIFFIPFLVIGFVSSLTLYKKNFGSSTFMWLAPLIFMTNSYILMITGGGQMQIALAYSLSPLVLLLFMDVSENLKPIITYKKLLKPLLLFSLVLSLQSMIDIRIVFIIVLIIGMYWVVTLLDYRSRYSNWGRDSVIALFIPLLFVLILNAFWILPTIISGKNPINELGSAFSTTDAVRYFSFATLENTVALLHPNWPENIFGKTQFMQWEFLLFPVFAFSSLFFLKNKQHIDDNKVSKHIIFFLLIALGGIFLAKGANEPFGDFYLWLFNHVPGFSLFRDPTKFYLAIALSYSMLIPFTVENLSKLLGGGKKVIFWGATFSSIVFAVLVLTLLFTTRQGLTGNLTGTFRSASVPHDDKKLDTLLLKDYTYGRVLYLPMRSRYSPYTSNHPPISGNALFTANDIPTLINRLDQENIDEILEINAISYIVIPFDSEKELFINDRKFDPTLEKRLAKQVETIPGVKRLSVFSQSAVYKVSSPHTHGWVNGKDNAVRIDSLNPTEYNVTVSNVKKGDILLIAENYDSGWRLRSDNLIVTSKPHRNINSFELPKDGTYTMMFYYQPQQYIFIGLVVTAMGSILMFFLFFLSLAV